MKELIQARNFYESLVVEKRKELRDTIAEDIMFYDEELQRRVIEILMTVSDEFGRDVAERNSFTI